MLGMAVKQTKQQNSVGKLRVISVICSSSPVEVNEVFKLGAYYTPHVFGDESACSADVCWWCKAILEVIGFRHAIIRSHITAVIRRRRPADACRQERQYGGGLFAISLLFNTIVPIDCSLGLTLNGRPTTFFDQDIPVLLVVLPASVEGCRVVVGVHVLEFVDDLHVLLLDGVVFMFALASLQFHEGLFV